MPNVIEKLSDQIRAEEPIFKYGETVLREVAKRVDEFGPDMPEFIESMVQIMRDANGVGLAAPQLGISKRILIYDTGEGVQALINPQILRTHGEQSDPPEGCLSIPGLRGVVKRAETITVKALDPDGNVVKLKAEGYDARVILHEVDHLDGILFIDRADPSTLKWLTPEELANEDIEEEDGAEE